MGRNARSGVNLNTGFTALELNEGNVERIFNECLANEEDKCSLDRHLDFQILRPSLTGKTSEEVALATGKFKKNKQTIQFLFGQIKNIHDSSRSILLREGFIKYDETVWTRDYNILFKLYCLAQSCGCITEFSSLKDDPDIISAIKATDCKPSLSPKDPNFPAWWEANISEWETGQ